MTPERLNELLAAFPSRRVAVIGDFFLDKYLDFDPALAEVSLETGKTANQVVGIRHSPGAAGNVVSNLASLGAGSLTAIGFTGDDGEGYELRQDLTMLGCDTSHLHYAPERRTPTYLKPQNILVPGLGGEEPRYDTKNRMPLPAEMEARIIDSLNAVIDRVDAVLVIDQADEANCGVLTDAVRDAVIEAGLAHPEIVFWTDSRQRAGLFRGTILKPNQFEAVKAAFDGEMGRQGDRAKETDGAIGRQGDWATVDDEIVLRAGDFLVERNGRPVFLTRSEQGIMVFHDGVHELVPGFRIHGEIDPTGAGDTVTASASLTLAAGGTFTEAAYLANLAAWITVQKLGVTGTASPDEMRQAYGQISG
ncbi:MAG: bifunctional heptose 7-phosphate kinase/heptose 1-phosphate adenyltransferase [Armatimonadota bacterium]